MVEHEVNLTVAVAAFLATVRAVDPEAVAEEDCAAVVEALARAEKASAGLRVLLVARAVLCDAPRRRGYADPAVWLARATGATTAECRHAIAAGITLGEGTCAATKAALRAGEVSVAEAAEITEAETAAAGSEADLLERASELGLARLREEARRRRLKAKDPDDLHNRQVRTVKLDRPAEIHSERSLRHGVAEGGMTTLTARLTPEVGAAVTARLDAEVDRRMRQARAAGSEPVHPEAVAADALADLVLGAAGTGRRRRAEVVVVCDVVAWWRGYATADEACHVLGGGPVPVALAQRLAAEGAFVKAVLHDGVAIHTVAHYRRHYPALLRTALDLGEPPNFLGQQCVDCGRRGGLQWDHVDPFGHGGPTAYDNLAPRCWPCHAEKTKRDYAAGLIPRPGPRHPRPNRRRQRTTAPAPTIASVSVAAGVA